MQVSFYIQIASNYLGIFKYLDDKNIFNKCGILWQKLGAERAFLWEKGERNLAKERNVQITKC